MKDWRGIILGIFKNSKNFLTISEIHQELQLTNSALSKMKRSTVKEVLLKNCSDTNMWNGEVDCFKLMKVNGNEFWSKRPLNDYEKFKPETIIVDSENFYEGSIKRYFHKLRERNKKLVSEKIREVLEHKGRLDCEVCDFNFEYFYGQRGKEFIECHHKMPLSKLTPKTITKLDDLAIVCANCHRMLHRKRFISVSALRKKLLVNQ